MPPLVSVVIPMHDEGPNVERTLREVSDEMKARGWDYEILPVDDGSSDDTASRLKEAARADARVRPVLYRTNRGRGYAMRQGFGASTGRIVATLDADLSYEPKDLARLVQTLLTDPDADVAIGSPYMPGGATEGVAPFRLWVSKLGNVVLRYSLPERIYTSTGILRAYRGKLLRSLDLEADDKEIHLEILSKAFALAANVLEVPATLRSRSRGSSHFRLSGTVASHLLFTVLERPAMIFGAVGVLLLVTSVIIGGYLMTVFLRGGLNPERPLMTVMVLLFLGGQAGLSFAILASQLLQLRRDMVRVQRDVLALRDGESEEVDGGSRQGRQAS